MKTQIIHSDPNYRDAINYSSTHYYNFPMTVKIKGHTLVIPFGQSDNLNEIILEDRVILVGENWHLNYISCIEIDTTRKFPEIVQDVFLDNAYECLQDFAPENESIFGQDTEDQYQAISNWFI